MACRQHRTLRGALTVYSQQPSEQPCEAAGAQQPSPRQASRPSRTATAAITRPATGSAHAQPSVALSTRPISSTADR